MFFASDISRFLSCAHILTLELACADGSIKKPFFNDLGVDLLRRLGLEHEQRYLHELTEHRKLSVVEIDVDATWADAVADTLEAMHGGADVIYQATLLDGNWGGRADFLIRVERPSALGQWSYEVVDTKLARKTKAGALIQLCLYSELLSKLQKLEPESMHLVLGGGSGQESFRFSRYSAYFRSVKRAFDEARNRRRNTYPEPTEYCDVCDWFSTCDQQWRKDDHLSLVAGITRTQRKALEQRGVETVATLGTLAIPPSPPIERIGAPALLRIREQARIQIQGRGENRTLYELLDEGGADRGLSILPKPDPGDVFLDLEATPFFQDCGLEYLFGFVTRSSNSAGNDRYQSIWAFTGAEEKLAFERLIDLFMEHWGNHPGMHIYHYAPYESTAIKRLAGRHNVRAEEIDRMLRAGLFVDLFRVVRQSLRASVESYSIKRLEPLYGFGRSVPLRDANAALINFEAALLLGGDRERLEEISEVVEAYNKDDCFSALRLRDWLEARRKDLESRLGRHLARPAISPGNPNEGLNERISGTAVLAERLTSDFDDDEGTWSEEQRARWLLAQMLEWHRREEKSEWWEYFRRCGLSDSELQEDNDALAGLDLIGEVERKRSVTYRYSFPAQDHTIDRAVEIHDPRTQKKVGMFVAINQRDRSIDLKRSLKADGHPTALIPLNRVSSEVLQSSLARLAASVADHGMTGLGDYQAARGLLLRRTPRCLAEFSGGLTEEGGLLTNAGKRVVHALASETTVLPIQGPPGSGKTFTAARMILELLRIGKRVGIAGNSHKVICNLLREVCHVAEHQAVSVRAIQKADQDEGLHHANVTITSDNAAVVDALRNRQTQLAAGTAWLWSREDMTALVDVLFVDEAGQMALANVLAMAPATTSIVLLGDPQQLDQPQRGVHPPGADVSALAYLLRGSPTIEPGSGLFLQDTYRLHPDVCSFTSELFYEGRLVPRPENSNQRLNCAGSIHGTGLRYLPVQHLGNTNESTEEVEAVAALIGELLGQHTTWTTKTGKIEALTLNDILIVAPYNAQVSALSRRLPAGARVGTVDKFQGQEAPLVIYSMASSTPEDAPRGMEFLYSLNRFNVAISRARCVALVVASPRLFEVQCKDPRQMELANAFCRYLEMARFVQR